MNTGIVDAIDLGWRLAAIIKGYGDTLILTAYSIERRPMMIRALVRSHRHLFEHVKLSHIFNSRQDLQVPSLDAPTIQGEALRQKVHAFLQNSAPETRDRGIEFDCRYYYSPIICQDHSVEPAWEVGRYTPSTRPGSRAPHVFLEDGETSIYDLFGSEFTLVQFEESVEDSKACKGAKSENLDNSASASARASNIFISTASSREIPLKHAYIKNQPHACQIWEKELVLIRPDTHVAWRGSCGEVLGLGEEGVHGIWDVVTGHIASSFAEKNPAAHTETERAFEEIVKDFLGEIRGREELGIRN
jgi:FAD-dependent monooxygenase